MKSKPTRIFGLLDCNSFFASCEKLFRPDLKNRPVVVLSNNDGCVVARAPEAKELGIPMGEPYFKIKYISDRNRVHIFSSNFRLYGDISSRIMRMLYRWTPAVEVYSIDEAFLDFTGLGYDSEGEPRHDSIEALAREIIATINKWIGIPVSIGIGPSKALSKVANDIAKKSGGGCFLLEPKKRMEALAQLEIGDLWGIGRRLAPKMRKLGIRNAKQFAELDPRWVRKSFSIVQEQLLRELNGENCIDFETVASAKKSIQVSRSFHNASEDFTIISEAIASFAARAAEKAGVVLLDLRNAKAAKAQGTLFPLDDKTPEKRLIQSMDRINEIMGRGSLFFGAQGVDRDWKGASDHCSPAYTGFWSQLPIAKAK